MWGPVEGFSLEAGDSAETGDGNLSGLAVWGFVSKNGNAHAAYYACWVPVRPERGLQLLIGVGKWGENTDPRQRKMAGLECRFNGERPAFMLVDADKVEQEELSYLGKGMKRSELMSDPLKDEIFKIADHISFSDPRIKSFLLSATGKH